MKTKFSDYNSTIKFLYNRLPAFQHAGTNAIKPSQKNILALCKFLGDPQNNFKTIHVAGTNGKGSSSHFISSILQEANFKTGLYTSPHLKDYTERFRINGIQAPEQEIIDFVNLIYDEIETINPSFFEVSVAFAFYWFAKEKVQIAVIEVGLGGRLDSTNIINPIISLITNIGYDHQQVLGETLSAIAYEKAGIIKQARPCVISEKQEETTSVFKKVADEKHSPLFFASDEYSIENIEFIENYLEIQYSGLENIKVKSELKGKYQAYNIRGVLSVFWHLNEMGYIIKEEAKEKGFRNVIENTGLKGRWQTLGENPLMIADTAHNSSGLHETINQLQSLKYNKLHLILGFVKDKDVNKILRMFPSDAEFNFCSFNSPRAFKASELAALNPNLKAQTFENINDAIRVVKSRSQNDDVIYIGGSTYLVSEINDL